MSSVRRTFNYFYLKQNQLTEQKLDQSKRQNETKTKREENKSAKQIPMRFTVPLV